MGTRRAVAAATGLVVGLGLIGPAAAADQVRYTGEFGGAIAYDTCEVEPAAGAHVAGGSWRVNVHGRTVTARFVITVDGEPHVAWTARMARVVDSDATFEAQIVTGAGPLSIRLEGDRFTYRIAPYDLTAYGGAKCASVTYSGTLSE